ncbi:hypothetical protein ICA16_14990 [Pseudomonas anatoliensis]|uniref:hypothetical protein n=1 Tax=Pseudomonas anatoliensis TaxID=2710589 RepID=UPI001B3224BF|nr:hypothetical protein [Pseudomonas anatoliensis]MBP5956976.1 hypothetical protein [Pseudomonas anatoliensis]
MKMHQTGATILIGQNSSFRRGEPTWANACVGENGQPSYVEYAKGFSAAANSLIFNVLETRGAKFSPDLLIYPICFNMRHAVELHLKGTADYLINFSSKRPPTIEFNLASSHDIGIIWNFIKTNSVRIDPRYSIIIQKMDQTISDIAKIDPTGQTFRYAFDKESKKHLVETYLINVKVLHDKFSKLENHLSDLNLLNEAIDEELRYGDRTSKLSRHDLYLIAKALPKRSSWGTEKFIQTKETIQKKLNISSNDFSRALTCIQKNYQLSHIIEAPLALLQANLETFIKFFDAWCITNDIVEYRTAFSDKEFDIVMIDTGSIDFLQDLLDDNRKEKEAMEKIRNNLDIHQMIDIETLYRLTSEAHYGERYPFLYNLYKSHAELDNRGIDGISDTMLGRFRAPDQIIKSLFFLGQRDIAEHLIARYELGDCFDWLADARNKTLFKEPWTWAFSEEDITKWDHARIGSII